MIFRRIALILALAGFSMNASCAALQNLNLGSLTESMTMEKIASGLTEALKVGSERAIADTSAEDGFWGDSLIQLALPNEIQPVLDAARTLGLGDQVDDLHLAINRAAEQASGEAVDVVVDVVTSLTIQDALDILYGGDTAATSLFRDRTTTELTRRFEPIVQSSMEAVGVYNIYNGIMNGIQRVQVPGIGGAILQQVTGVDIDAMQSFDLERYVVDRALNGVFTKIEGEERRIRGTVSSRTTELLQDVFSFRDSRTRAEAEAEVN